MPNPTLADVALRANVSLATVDRVLNDRSGVSDRTRARVLSAATDIGYLETGTATLAPVRLAFVLPEGTNAFVHELARHVTEQSGLMEQVSASVERVTGFDPVALAEKIAALRSEVDGIAMLAVDHPIVREAVRSLVADGKAVTTIGSDVRTVDHLGYIGIDDMQAGRLAGYLIGRLTGAESRREEHPGKVAFFAGSLSYRGHQEREMGFRQILREEFGGLTIAAHREVQDSRALAETEMEAILREHPDIVAVYNAGGGTAGIAAVLERTGRAEDITFIAHDLTDGNTSFLLRGTLDAVIDQNARHEVREALTTLVHAVRGTAYRMVPPRLQIVFRENLPSG
ncbi:LacI family DNA-binding transcriptional regulator [Flavimaricola marinus]|uniref:HTH-type transcriptional regulator DegA n=1 Tax=Flavimaricola marinus TaxID=1819565 RepID=A0A238L9A5_9RHOB|nr:LacI family DNA-binding transcriptional regulator [Flavimaricola marinus]SMY06181.1 HTH-type transcriptional regulator DegA [Flavimaricola marinus]